MQTAPCAAHGRALQIGKDNAVERMDWKNTVDALAGKWDVSAAVTAWAGDTVLYNAVYGYADRSAGRALRQQQRYCFSITSDLLLGLGAGYLLMRLLEDMLGMTLTMSAGVAELAIGFSMAVGVIFGLYPADKASKLKPIDALHYD